MHSGKGYFHGVYKCISTLTLKGINKDKGEPGVTEDMKITILLRRLPKNKASRL